MQYRCIHCRKGFERPAVGFDSCATNAPTEYRAEPVCPHCGCDGFEEKERLKASKKQLRQYLDLKRENELASERLASMRAGGVEDDQLYEMIENNRLRVLALMLKTQQFIYSIDDSLIRSIFELRYIHGLKWAGVAARLGGYYSEDYVRITHDRYLSKNSHE